MRRCPICKKVVDAADYAPFCSERCKLIDLGKWLDEGYRIPDDPVRDDDHPKEDA